MRWWVASLLVALADCSIRNSGIVKVLWRSPNPAPPLFILSLNGQDEEMAKSFQVMPSLADSMSDWEETQPVQ